VPGTHVQVYPCSTTIARSSPPLQVTTRHAALSAAPQSKIEGNTLMEPSTHRTGGLAVTYCARRIG
jgi:hypothetical protein